MSFTLLSLNSDLNLFRQPLCGSERDAYLTMLICNSSRNHQFATTDIMKVLVPVKIGCFENSKGPVFLLKSAILIHSSFSPTLFSPLVATRPCFEVHIALLQCTEKNKPTIPYISLTASSKT